MSAKSKDLIPEKRILKIIIVIRGENVILDSDLAKLYGVETRRLNEQVRRNIEKFPDDFMFQLTKEEFENLKSQIATSSSGWGGQGYLPGGFCPWRKITQRRFDGDRVFCNAGCFCT